MQSLKIKFVSLLFPSLLFAFDFHVTQIKGNIFAINGGKARHLKLYDKIHSFDEIITEENSFLGIENKTQIKIRLASMTHAQILNKMVELIRGHIWVESHNTDKITLITANSIAELTIGEVILSFDNTIGRSQILALKGHALFKNSMREVGAMEVQEGQFSLLENNLHQGLPRKATSIGENSYTQFLSIFQKENVDSIKQDIKPGKFIFVKETQVKRTPFSLQKFYKKKLKIINKMKSKNFQVYGQRSETPLKIYSTQAPKKRRKMRSRAKITKKSLRLMKNKARQNTPVQKDFDDSMVGHYKEQVRHREEVNQLIDELKSYRQEYKKDF